MGLQAPVSHTYADAVADVSDDYFELSLTAPDGTPIEPRQFKTVEDAMAAAKEYPGAEGEICYYGESGDPVNMVTYNADGTGYVSAEFFGDDPDYYDQPWTLEEVERNQTASAHSDLAEEQ